MPVDLLDKDTAKEKTLDFDESIVNEYLATDAGKGGFRGEWKHDKSASSAYWDPRGRSIVSTSYDDTIRCMYTNVLFCVNSFADYLSVWDIQSPAFKADAEFPSMRPFCHIKHNCQTVIIDNFLSLLVLFDTVYLQGKWLTILRAQWSPNPDIYPHFTVRRLNMILSKH